MHSDDLLVAFKVNLQNGLKILPKIMCNYQAILASHECEEGAYILRLSSPTKGKLLNLWNWNSHILSQLYMS